MALVNVEEATKHFEKLLESGFYRSRYPSPQGYIDPNEEYDPDDIEGGYSKFKEERDTKACIEFANSPAFKQILNALT